MSTATYFDGRFETMARGNSEMGLRSLAYDQQAALVESLIEPGMTVLDVGCGPSLPYDGSRAWMIGLDPSVASLAANTDVDERIVGSAQSIPLPSQSADLVVAFYSVHHMTGRTPYETFLMRCGAVAEMARVTRPGGEILIFEMSPHRWAARLQSIVWPLAKRLLGDRLDAHFYGRAEYDAIGGHRPMDVQTFQCPPFSTFPPVFALPWLRVPRFLYPLTPTLYRWRS